MANILKMRSIATGQWPGKDRAATEQAHLRAFLTFIFTFSFFSLFYIFHRFRYYCEFFIVFHWFTPKSLFLTVFHCFHCLALFSLLLWMFQLFSTFLFVCIVLCMIVPFLLFFIDLQNNNMKYIKLYKNQQHYTYFFESHWIHTTPCILIEIIINNTNHINFTVKTQGYW